MYSQGDLYIELLFLNILRNPLSERTFRDSPGSELHTFVRRYSRDWRTNVLVVRCTVNIVLLSVVLHFFSLIWKLMSSGINLLTDLKARTAVSNSHRSSTRSICSLTRISQTDSCRLRLQIARRPSLRMTWALRLTFLRPYPQITIP